MDKTRKINILLAIGSLHIGGAEDHVLQILESLDRTRFHPHLLVMEKAGGLLPRAAGLGSDIIEFPFYRRYILHFIQYLVPYILFLKRNKIDTVHSHLFECNLFAITGALLARVPKRVMTLHNVINPGDAGYKLRMIKALSLLATDIVAVSEQVKQSFVERIGIAASRIRVIHNGIKLPEFPKRDTAAIREEFARPDEFLVGIIGTLLPQKNHQCFLDAAKIIAGHLAKVRFVIVGDGYLRETIRNYCEKLGLQQHVMFTGFRNDIPAILSILDVYVSSSLWEGFSIALLEAMSAGLPVVMTDVGGNREAVTDGINGFLVQPNDAEAIARRVIELLNNRPLARQLGEKARATVTSSFTAEIMTQKLMQVYQPSANRRYTD